MRAIILAGGVGSRLERLTEGKPKCLAEIGGRPLILHQLEALSDQGVGPVLMVVGYRHEAIREVVGNRVEYIVNERYAETNSLYSLWLARDWVTAPFVLLNSDLFFDPEILRRVLEEPGTVLAYDSTSSRGQEQTKVALRERRVVDLGKDLPPRSARGESLGLLKFDEPGTAALFTAAEHVLEQGGEKSWVIEATRAAARSVHVYGVNIAGLPWTEVDFPYDLEQARREVWPAIFRGRWGRTVFWRRGRWAVAALAALVLAISGWFASTRVGPASVDWESVAPLNGRRVTLRLADRSQKWWAVEGRDTLVARIEGSEPLRLEFRLVMPAGTTDTARYAVALALDGVPFAMDAFTAAPDSSVELAGAVVGDRDRLELNPRPGARTLQLSLLRSRDSRLLVRIRQPE